jgi:hypothetical protein
MSAFADIALTVSAIADSVRLHRVDRPPQLEAGMSERTFGKTPTISEMADQHRPLLTAGGVMAALTFVAVALGFALGVLVGSGAL